MLSPFIIGKPHYRLPCRQCQDKTGFAACAANPILPLRDPSTSRFTGVVPSNTGPGTGLGAFAAQADLPQLRRGGIILIRSCGDSDVIPGFMSTADFERFYAETPKAMLELDVQITTEMWESGG